RRQGGTGVQVPTDLRPAARVPVPFRLCSFAPRGREGRSDVDLLVVGSADVPALFAEIQTLEAKLGRELSPVVWTEDDLDRQVKERSPFLATVRAEPKIWIVGDEDEFEGRTRELARPSPRRRAAD